MSLTVEHRAPWLVADLGAEMRMLSWSMSRPGFTTAQRVAWREVRDADLTPDLDVERWLASELAAADLSDALALVTSRSVAKHHRARHTAGKAMVECLATVGLSNAERIGYRRQLAKAGQGTINALAIVTPGLGTAAMVEAIAIAAEAKTTAVLDARRTVATGTATGTGTDCLVIASPVGETCYAGTHTEVGEALGRAVYDAVSAGAAEWMAEIH